MGRPWTTREIGYLHNNACDGVESIAKALNRSVRSVECCASRYGVSLRGRWVCPRCGKATFAPLSPRYGWCRTCCIKKSRDNALQKNRAVRVEIEAEKARLLDAKRARQAVYSDTDRRKNELRRIRESREEGEKRTVIC